MFSRLSVVAALVTSVGSLVAEPVHVNCDVTYLQTTRMYYDPPAFTISDISGDECLVTNIRI